MPGVTRARMLERVARDVGEARVYLAPELGAELAPLLAAGARPVSTTADAEIGVVAARVLRADGTVELASADGAQLSPRLVLFAVVAPLRVQESASPATGPCVRRVFSPEAVLEVTADGIVISELAPGVSARDLQALATPTLKVTHLVREYGASEA